MTARKQVPEDVLKEASDRARAFFRFDLTYIAAMLAIATAMKLEGSHLYDAIGAAARFAYAICALVLIDTVLPAYLFGQWADVKRGGEFRRPILFEVLVSLQPVAHGIFVAYVLVAAFAPLEARNIDLSVYRAEAELQEAVEGFAVKEKHYPTSLDELAQRDPSVPAVLTRLSGERIAYERAGDTDYKLTFRAGPSHNADLVATHELNLRNVVDEVEKTPPFP